MRKFILFCTALFLITAPACMHSQENKPVEAQNHYYHLSFVVQEVDENGKVTNSRTYTTTIVPNGTPGQIRTGDKIPILTNEKGDTQYQYVDIGVNIDSRSPKEVNGKLSLRVDAEISSVAKTPSGTPSPIIRSNKWGADVLVPIGKPAVIFSSDDLQSKGKIQVELTATHIE
jgi:hypothetical protein